MAYRITRNHIVEELEIEDNGKTVTLEVDINVDQILRDYNKANYAIAMARQTALNAKNDDDMSKAEEALGEGVLALFEVCFGTEQTKQIIEIYQNRTIEMLSDIAPFIADVIQPRIFEAQARIEERYKQASKKGRR